MATVNCPSCGRALEVEAAYREWTVRCPHCASEFVPAEVSPELAEPERDEPPDDYDRPRRRRRPFDSGYDERWDREEAARLAYGPGLSLELCGWFYGLALAAVSFLFFALALDRQNNPNAGNNGDPEMFLLLGVLAAVLGVPYALILIVGGRKMRSLSSHGWAMTASVVAIGSFMLFCSVHICSLIPIGFGVWGVLILNNPLVRRGFDAEQRQVRREWYD